MADLINIKFQSNYNIDGEVEKIEFMAKGYKKVENEQKIIYFKHDHAYKFILGFNELEVNVDTSVYKFNCNKKTEAIISGDDYSYKVSVNTKVLNILDNKIDLIYELDFGGFKGEYQIILELL